MTLILFDLDGTLIDVGRRHYSLYRSVISEQGVGALSPGDYWRHRRVGESTIDLLAATPGVDVERFTVAWMEGIELASETGRRVICLSYGVRSGRYLAGRGAETVIGSLRELPEVINAAERSGGPADVEQGVAPRNVHARARF